MKRITLNLDLEKISTNNAVDLVLVLYRIEEDLDYKCKSVSNSINKIQDFLFREVDD
jgi:hypothetical protein